ATPRAPAAPLARTVGHQAATSREVEGQAARARRRIASTDRSTSASVVVALETEIRIRRRPRHVVPPIQQVPSRWTAAITRSVVASSPKLTSTWLSTTWLHTSNPAAASPSANRRASAQHRSTRSATPERPSSRRAAHTANPRARRDDSAVKSASAGSPPDPTRYEAAYDIAAAWTSGREQNAKPQSYGTLSHLCPSHAHESASSTPSTRWRVDGLAAAHSPKAPSTWTQAPC